MSTEISSTETIPNCDACALPCERGQRETYEGDKRTRVICLDCADREDLAAYMKTGRLKSRFMITATLRWDRWKRGTDPTHIQTRNRAYEKPAGEVEFLQKAVRTFDRAVWLPYMRQQVDDEKVCAGMSFERDGLVVRTFVTAGRAMVHIERGDSWVSTVTEEGGREPRMGLQGIDATAEEATRLLADATAAFLGGAVLTADKNVGIG